VFLLIASTLFAFLFYFFSYMHRLFIKKTIISTLKSIELGYDCEYPLVRIIEISTDQYCIHPYCIARSIYRIVSSIVELIVYLYMFKVLLLVVEYDLFDYQLYLHWIHRYHQVISTLNALFDYFCCIYSIKYNLYGCAPHILSLVSVAINRNCPVLYLLVSNNKVDYSYR
jgi:hypothetical protein